MNNASIAVVIMALLCYQTACGHVTYTYITTGGHPSHTPKVFPTFFEEATVKKTFSNLDVISGTLSHGSAISVVSNAAHGKKS